MAKLKYVQVKVKEANEALHVSKTFADARGKKTLAFSYIINHLNKEHSGNPFQRNPPKHASALSRWFSGGSKIGVPADIWASVEKFLGVPPQSLSDLAWPASVLGGTTRLSAKVLANARELANLELTIYPRKANSISTDPHVKQTISLNATVFFGPSSARWTTPDETQAYTGYIQIRSARLDLRLSGSRITGGGSGALSEQGVAVINGKSVHSMGSGDGAAAAWSINHQDLNGPLGGQLNLRDFCWIEGHSVSDDRLTLSVQPAGLEVTNLRNDDETADVPNEIRAQIRRRLIEIALRNSLASEASSEVILAQATVWEV